MSETGQKRRFDRAPATSGLTLPAPHKRTISEPVSMSQRCQQRTYFALNSGLISPASVMPSICPSFSARGKTQNGASGSNGAGSPVML
jgi:hypothetical protein